MAADDVPDSTDWLSTPLACLAAVEASLRCQVCKDFYKTPMITSCSHTFCSLCIRRALSNEGRCPGCRAPEQELKLRSNWSMEDAVESFSKARPLALDLAQRASAAHRSPKRKAEDIDMGDAPTAPETKRLRTSARLSKNRSEATTPPPPTNEGLRGNDAVIEVSDDDEYVPGTTEGFVACPVCQRKMKEWQVFKHLETCPGPNPQPQPQQHHHHPQQQQIRESSIAPTLGQTQRQQQKTLERMPALNYSMLKESALRKKMLEMGISNQGPRSLLEKRHKEWITLWNANCDAARPKKRSELLQDLDIWERTQGSRAPTASRSVQNAAIIKDKEFDGASWAAKHESSFKDLIESARRTRLEATKKVSGEKEESNAEPEPVDETEEPAANARDDNNRDTRESRADFQIDARDRGSESDGEVLPLDAGGSGVAPSSGFISSTEPWGSSSTTACDLVHHPKT